VAGLLGGGGSAVPEAERTARWALTKALAVLRIERGLSRQDLAEALGVNYQTIGYLEDGEYNPSLDLALPATEHSAPPGRRFSVGTPVTTEDQLTFFTEVVLHRRLALPTWSTSCPASSRTGSRVR
jgi:putative transcriptional regulator